MKAKTLLLTYLTIALGAAPAFAYEVDWNGAAEEAVMRLETYLRIDTTNPPGNETAAAELIRGWLEAERIEVSLYDPMNNPARQAVVGRLPGKSDRTLLLMSHSDVVPAIAEEWSQPPFAAKTVNGAMYARGALDTKGLGILQLMAMALLRRQGIVPDDTIVLLIEPDEEEGGGGINGMWEKHADLFANVHMVLNEGGAGTRDLIKPGQVIFFVQSAEKGAAWMKLTAKGDSGHGSVPLKNNAVAIMAQALDRIAHHQTTIRPSAPVIELFQSMAAEMPFPMSFVMRHVDKRPVQYLFHGKLTERPLINSLLRTTISLTGVHGGYKTNVIPSQVEATIDVRVNVGDDGESVRKELEAVVADPRVRIELVSNGTPNSSPVDPELMAAMREVTGRHHPGSLVAPFMSSGVTDSAPFRHRGIKAYGINPIILNEKEMSTMHGIDERVPIDAYKRAVRVYYDLIVKLAVRNPSGSPTPHP